MAVRRAKIEARRKYVTAPPPVMTRALDIVVERQRRQAAWSDLQWNCGRYQLPQQNPPRNLTVPPYRHPKQSLPPVNGLTRPRVAESKTLCD